MRNFNLIIQRKCSALFQPARHIQFPYHPCTVYGKFHFCKRIFIINSPAEIGKYKIHQKLLILIFPFFHKLTKLRTDLSVSFCRKLFIQLMLCFFQKCSPLRIQHFQTVHSAEQCMHFMLCFRFLSAEKAPFFRRFFLKYRCLTAIQHIINLIEPSLPDSFFKIMGHCQNQCRTLFHRQFPVLNHFI